MFGGIFDNDGDEEKGPKESIDLSNFGRVVKAQKPPERRGDSGFVGLDNQGATCYLNSLIQAMYMTPELRSGLFNIAPKDLGVDLLEEYERDKKEAAVSGIVEADESLVEQLKEFGMSEHSARRALIAVTNAGVMEAFDYADQHPEEMRLAEAQGASELKKKKRKPRLIPLELQRLFSQMQMLNKRSLSTNELTSRGFSWQGMDGAIQHDAHELNRLLIEALEKSLKHTSGEKLCQDLYKGTLVNQIKCTSCQRISEREEHFYDLNVQVLDCPDLAVSLRRYCAAEVLQGDCAYQCDVCEKKRTALRSTVLRELPPILTLSCNRFKIDRTTNWQRVKLTSKSEFPLVLDIDPFLEGRKGTAEALSDDAAVEEVFRHELRGNMVWLGDIVADAKKIACSLVDRYGINVRYESLSTQEKSEIEKTLKAAHVLAQEKLQGGCQSQNPIGYNDSIYQLFAVIMHRGSAHSGHYFAYIRDNSEEGHWALPDKHYGVDERGWTGMRWRSYREVSE